MEELENSEQVQLSERELLALYADDLEREIGTARSLDFFAMSGGSEPRLIEDEAENWLVSKSYHPETERRYRRVAVDLSRWCKIKRRLLPALEAITVFESVAFLKRKRGQTGRFRSMHFEKDVLRQLWDWSNENRMRRIVLTLPDPDYWLGDVGFNPWRDSLVSSELERIQAQKS
jgi:hypothetical protein